MSSRRVIADIGGTNGRFAIAENGSIGKILHVEIGKYASLRDALASYIEGLPRNERPSAAAVAIAGPVFGDRVTLTNLGWSFSISETMRDLGLASLDIVNDFAATAMAIPYLPNTDRVLVGPPGPEACGPVGIIGPGTGLGVSGLLRKAQKWMLVPGEGGHVTLPSSTTMEDRILEVFRARWPHVSAERALSGPGLVNLYQAVCTIDGVAAHPFSPADVTDHAVRGTDMACVKAFDHFCAMLGTVAGDLALTLGATGGVYIAGGILLRFRDYLAASAFRERFESKGRFRDFMRKIPTYIIMEESPALLGLANFPLDG